MNAVHSLSIAYEDESSKSHLDSVSNLPSNRSHRWRSNGHQVPTNLRSQPWALSDRTCARAIHWLIYSSAATNSTMSTASSMKAQLKTKIIYHRQGYCILMRTAKALTDSTSASNSWCVTKQNIFALWKRSKKLPSSSSKLANQVGKKNLHQKNPAPTDCPESAKTLNYTSGSSPSKSSTPCHVAKVCSRALALHPRKFPKSRELKKKYA